MIRTRDGIAEPDIRDGPISSASAPSPRRDGQSESRPAEGRDKKDDFVNRAMNKLISTITPNVSHTGADRRIQEQIREMEAAERQLDHKCGRIHDLQCQLEAVVQADLAELDQCEAARLGLMKVIIAISLTLLITLPITLALTRNTNPNPLCWIQQ